MTYYCLCDYKEYSYIFLLLDYTIRLGNVIGFFYFVVNSQYFNEFFKNILHGGNSEWVKIKKEDYNIINSDSNESDSENEHQEDGKESLDQ